MDDFPLWVLTTGGYTIPVHNHQFGRNRNHGCGLPCEREGNEDGQVGKLKKQKQQAQQITLTLPCMDSAPNNMKLREQIEQAVKNHNMFLFQSWLAKSLFTGVIVGASATGASMKDIRGPLGVKPSAFLCWNQAAVTISRGKSLASWDVDWLSWLLSSQATGYPGVVSHHGFHHWPTSKGFINCSHSEAHWEVDQPLQAPGKSVGFPQHNFGPGHVQHPSLRIPPA